MPRKPDPKPRRKGSAQARSEASSAGASPSPAAPTWAGRIPGGPAYDAWTFMHSLPDDVFLAQDDISGSIAHIEALRHAGVLTTAEARKLTAELRRLRDELDPQPADEDIHSAIERTLTERLGDLGAKVHAGRSRNDQVATALRLYLRRAVLDLWSAVGSMQDTLTARASETRSMLAPGYTHLQRAQPVTVAHWLLAHAWALERDGTRLEQAYTAADCSVLGAGALAGSTLGIDPRIAAGELGFTQVFHNTLDAVSDRDFLLDAVYAATVAATHLSRLAEEIVLWSSAEFRFVHLPDAYATGSSMMPQKKNPDVAELARAQAGVNLGVLTGLCATLKALPLAYDRDLQADKRHLASTMAKTTQAFAAMRGLVGGLQFDAVRLAAACDDTMLATDLAEALVARGVPFRVAHERVAGMARQAAESRTLLRDVLAERPEALAPIGPGDAAGLLDPAAALRRRTTPGGPSPVSTAAQVRRLTTLGARRDKTIDRLRSTLPA